MLQQLNSFHPNIQFTYELEKKNKIPFLNVLFIRKHSTFETTVYRKGTNTDIYLNWQYFAPNTLKRDTFKVLINRAYNICSTNYHLTNELKHLENVFRYRNSYPHWIIKQIFEQVCIEQKRDLNSNVNACINDNSLSETSAAKVAYATLPYKVRAGEKVLKPLKSSIPVDTRRRFNVYMTSIRKRNLNTNLTQCTMLNALTVMIAT